MEFPTDRAVGHQGSARCGSAGGGRVSSGCDQ